MGLVWGRGARPPPTAPPGPEAGVHSLGVTGRWWPRPRRSQVDPGGLPVAQEHSWCVTDG